MASVPNLFSAVFAAPYRYEAISREVEALVTPKNLTTVLKIMSRRTRSATLVSSVKRIRSFPVPRRRSVKDMRQ